MRDGIEEEMMDCYQRGRVPPVDLDDPAARSNYERALRQRGALGSTGTTGATGVTGATGPVGSAKLREHIRALKATSRPRVPVRASPLAIMALAAFAIVLAIIVLVSKAHALDHGFSLIQPKTDKSLWIESLKRPDTSGSCCGAGDLYEADIYDVDGYDRGRKMCEAVITEGSEKTFPDGAMRQYIPNGTRWTFPCSKVNPPKDGNPTGHAVAFLATWQNKITGTYCFVPLPPGM